MNVLDYIIFAFLAISLITGFVKGFIKQLLTVVGVIVVPTLTATATPYVQTWLGGIEQLANISAPLAMFATLILVALIYAFVAWLIGKILRKIKIIKALDKILGGLMGIVVTYLVFAVFFGLFTYTKPEFLPTIRGWLGDSLETSWFGANIYGNNFFGQWVIEGIWEKLIDSLQPSTEALIQRFAF